MSDRPADETGHGVHAGGARKQPGTRVRRIPKRGLYDRETIEQILDAGLVGHLGYVADGIPVVIPTLHARLGDRVYVHGSSAAASLRAAGSGLDVCLTVTLLDGLVLARSAFNHSANYRSAMVFGVAEPIEGSEKAAALEAFTEKLVPGRWRDIRPPTDQELKATAILALGLDTSSAKVRTGPPGDDEADYALDAWAGVIPITEQRGEPIPDPKLRPGIAIPDYL